MKSRLLRRLEADIASAKNPRAADCLRCERAAYLARLGEFDTARQELVAVQQRHATRPNAGVSAWVNLGEALVSFYSDLGPASHDKMKRAYALSSAVGLQPLQALSAAWLAHFAYLRMDIGLMARYATEALSLAGEDNHGARARATLVVAQSYHEGGRLDLARPWYDLARRHAAAEGDDVALSAMMWNMASLRVAALRQAEALGPAHAFAGEHALLSAESTAHFDAMLGVRSLQALQPILRAQICTLLGRTEEALPLFEAHVAVSLAQGMASAEGSLRADRAWCRLKAGHREGAEEEAGAAEACLALAHGTFGDRAPGHSRLVQVFEVLGDAGAVLRQKQLAETTWQAHILDQANLVDTLNREFATSRG